MITYEEANKQIINVCKKLENSMQVRAIIETGDISGSTLVMHITSTSPFLKLQMLIECEMYFIKGLNENAIYEDIKSHYISEVKKYLIFREG